MSCGTLIFTRSFTGFRFLSTVYTLSVIGTVFLLYDFKNMLFFANRRHKLYFEWIERLKNVCIFKILYISTLSIKQTLECNKNGGLRG